MKLKAVFVKKTDITVIAGSNMPLGIQLQNPGRVCSNGPESQLQGKVFPKDTFSDFL